MFRSGLAFTQKITGRVCVLRKELINSLDLMINKRVLEKAISQLLCDLNLFFTHSLQLSLCKFLEQQSNDNKDLLNKVHLPNQLVTQQAIQSTEFRSIPQSTSVSTLLFFQYDLARMDNQELAVFPSTKHLSTEKVLDPRQVSSPTILFELVSANTQPKLLPIYLSMLLPLCCCSHLDPLNIFGTIPLDQIQLSKQTCQRSLFYRYFQVQRSLLKK